MHVVWFVVIIFFDPLEIIHLFSGIQLISRNACNFLFLIYFFHSFTAEYHIVSSAAEYHIV